MDSTANLTRRVLLAAAGFTLVLAGLVAWAVRPKAEDLLARAEERYRQREYQRADELVQQALAQARAPRALCLAGRIAAAQRQGATALEYFEEMASGAGLAEPAPYLDAAKVALALGRAARAEAFLRSALSRDPDHPGANSQLAYLLSVEGRCFEAAPHLMRAVQQGEVTAHHLVLLGATVPVISDAELVQRCLKAVPEDRLPLLGTARTAMVEHDVEKARAILEEIVRSAPAQSEAQARLGTLLLDAPGDAYPRWHAALPKAANEHPEIWMVRGMKARRDGQARVAIRCFWEALRRDPEHRAACYALGQMLQSSGDAARAALLLERASGLQKLAVALDQVYDHPDDPRRMRLAAELADTLGRGWEARAWAELAIRLQPQAAWARALTEKLEGRLPYNDSRTDPSRAPALTIDLSDNPLPNWSELAPRAVEVVEGEIPPLGFTEDAKAAGIDFVFHSGYTPGSEAKRMVETIGGGGVGVIDFDLDGWPDLLFTQGGPWPPQSAQPRWTNRLFRNLGNGTFQDATAQAGAGTAGYAQGVAVGDYDNDGFPDLYVARIGGNRLLHNNGDGTFTDVTAASGLHGERWTSSCLIADLNGDGWPDLYDVNYLSAKDAPATLCPKGLEDKYGSPAAFASEQDQVWVNQGDGRFEDATERAGIVCSNGKGLGVVAADFDGSHRLSLFVGNDGVPNFFFVNRTASPGGQLAFAEQGLVSGLALDGDGLPHATMGIAAGDVNGDGRIDLFISSFSEQANVLFLQQIDRYFSDATRQFGLHHPSFRVGFGAQFLDADLDGWPDLVWANGHIFDRSEQGVPFRMQPQAFYNVQGKQFREVPADKLGDYFRNKYLGRGLARIDWNRDGREDFAVSNMNDPAALVSNRTPRPGAFLAVRLRGTASAADALGATVEVRCGQRTWLRQLIGGDGYQASNQRQLVFGLGRNERIDRVVVRWPSGLMQEFSGPPVGGEVLLVEGGGAFRLPSPSESQR